MNLKYFDRFLKAIIVFSMSLLLSACAAALIPGMMPAASGLINQAATGISGAITGDAEIKVDPDDPCGQQRVALGDSRRYFLKSIISGALIGAAVGAGVGLLAGGGQMVGQAAAAGALVGGMAAGAMAKHQENADAQAMQASLGSEVLSEYQEIDKATQSFITLRDCRFNAAHIVKSDYRAKRITRDEAQQKLNRLNTWFDDDLVIAEEIGVKMSERAKQYSVKSDELISTDPVANKVYTQWVAQQKQPITTTSKSSSSKRAPKAKSTPKIATKPSVPKIATSEKQKIAKGDITSRAKMTHTNVMMQANYTNSISQAKQMKITAFALDGSISMNWFVHLYS